MANPHFVLTAHSPHSVTWLVNADPDDAELDLLLTDALVDCAPGPLKVFLETQRGVAWNTHEPRENPEFRVYVTPLYARDRPPAAVGVAFFGTGADNIISVYAGIAAVAFTPPGTLTVTKDIYCKLTLEFAQSSVR